MHLVSAHNNATVPVDEAATVGLAPLVGALAFVVAKDLI